MANTMLVGYKLVDSNGAVCGQWGGIWGQCPDIPNPLILPNDVQICGVTEVGPVGDSGYAIEGWYMDQPVVIPAVISRRQCATQLRNMGFITQPEAFAMASAATIPPFVQSYFDAMTQSDKENAELSFTAVEYSRSNPLLVSMMLAAGLSQEEIDNFFIDASKL
jgi:hypothetical protein